MRILLTGGTGFVGSHVAETLSALGHPVRALVRASSDTRFLEQLPGLELAAGSVRDPASLDRAVTGCDVVIHAAGLVKARRTTEFFEVNAQGTHNVVEAAATAGQLRRLVHVSSLAAAGPSVDGRPIDEGTPPRPVNAYGRSKRAGELAVMAAAETIPVTVIRPPLVYGPRDRETLSFFRAISRGSLPVIGDGTNTLSVLYVTDCASAIVAAALSDGPTGRTYFVEDGEVLVWREALKAIETAVGRTARVRAGMPIWTLRMLAAANQARGMVTGTPQMLTLDKVRELEQRHWVCSSAAARKDLAWTPQVPWSQGTASAAEWHRNAGWL